MQAALYAHALVQEVAIFMLNPITDDFNENQHYYIFNILRVKN